jgi:RNA polymerase sigma-70 factor, ECF subfamily
MSEEREKTIPAEDEDMKAVQRCLKGEIDAFEPLVRRHQKKMVNIAFRMLGDYEEACDAVQDAFVAAYRSLRQFRGEARFSTWLTRIVLNHSKNRLKQMRARGGGTIVSIDDPVETPSGDIPRELCSREDTILDHLERKEVNERVKGAIKTLDSEHREVIILRDIEGFSYEEMRDILKIPEGTVKSRVFRAREALREQLKKVFGDL